MHKTFKIASVSSNRGAFGHHGYILIARDGEAWEVQRIPENPGGERWVKGGEVNVPLSLAHRDQGDIDPWTGKPRFNAGQLQWGRVSVECPRQLENAPEGVVRELWGDPPPAHVHKPILELVHNGDPYGSGFTARQSDDDGHSWYHRGDIGPQTRGWWRHFARSHGFRLREATGQYNLRAEKNRATVPA